MRAGEPLFSLDARNDEVNIAKAQAQLAKDQATLADAERQLARSQELFAQNFISQGAVDTNQAVVDAQQAVVRPTARPSTPCRSGLSYARIVAPTRAAPARSTSLPAARQPTGTPGHHHAARPDPVAFSLPQRKLGDALKTLRSGGGKVYPVLPEAAAPRSASSSSSE